jgi:OOP family OmpA-OmpF porin
MNNFGKFGMAVALASFVVASQAAPVAYQAKPVNDNWANGTAQQVWKNGTDELCWRDNNWTPATANAQCDGATAPAPAAAAAPAKAPISGTFTLGADGAFALGSATITKKGKATLDDAIGKLRNFNLQSVSIKGYTDSQGAAAANQTLSDKRAQNVKNYLVSSGAVPPSAASSAGFGASNYVIDPASCKGMKVNGRPVSRTVCEAANRRVDIEFKGTAK